MSVFASDLPGVPPFCRSIHLKCDKPTAEQAVIVNEFRTALKEFPLYKEHMDWANDEQLLRFLIARNFNLAASADLIKNALKWRDMRKPGEIEQSQKWPEGIEKEGETGKIYCPGYDRWGRSVLVFDNAVQNTKCVDDQMTFLAWNLEFAIKLMKPNVDKYLVFLHLRAFSIFNNPPLAATKETINMLCNCYPERLGHCIAYQPPIYFRIFFNTVKAFLDPKTASKVVFIIGDVSEGSENDLKMRELIGDNWKEMVGAEKQPLKPGSGPGYDHDAYWPTVMSRLEELVTPLEKGECTSCGNDSVGTELSSTGATEE